MEQRRKLVAGNWKMNGDAATLAQAASLPEAASRPGCDVLLCPPATLIAALATAVKGRGIAVGGQDCHPAQAGAHTGDIAAEMLAAAGASAVILGHSERRADHGETSALVAAKALAAWRAGLLAIVCLGETREQRESGQAEQVVGAQLAASVPPGASAHNLVVAYEPVWSIGTGLVALPEQIAQMHAFLRARLLNQIGPAAQGVRLLYGGSVKAGNAAGIFALPDVDGALVGGASLSAQDFAPIIAAANAA